MPCSVDTEGSPKPSEGLTGLLEATEPSGDGDDVVHDVLLDTERLGSSLSRAETERPVYEVEDHEHDGEHHEEHVVHLGPVVLLQDLTEFAIVFRKFPCSFSFQATFLFLPEKIGVTHQSTEDKEDADKSSH